jgi:protein O-mannosyl-transferase
LPAAALIAITITIYAQSLGNGFVWDDEQIIVSNPETRDLSALGTVLLSPDEFPPYYRPLNRASYLIDYHLFGMDARGFHAVSLLIHATTVLALYALGRCVFETRAPAFAAALLLAIHPVNVEAVEFISGRNNLLALLFAILSVTLLIHGRRRPSPGLAIASGVAFFLGMLSKESAFMALPFMAAWLAFPKIWGDSRDRQPRLAWLAPHAVALAIYLVARAVALGAVVGSAPSSVAGGGAGLVSRLVTNVYTVPRYLALVLFPRDLAIFHVVPSSWPVAALVIAWVLIGTTVAYFFVRPSTAATAGLIWFALSLVPIANLVPVPTTSLIAERYFYAPAVGLWLLVAEGLRRTALRIGWRATVAVAAVLAVALSVRTVQRARDWHDDLALATSAVRAEPAAPEAYYNLGVVLKDAGDLQGARREWGAALKLDASHARALTQLATADAVEGNLLSAETNLRRALALDPTIAIAHYNLGRIYDLGGQPMQAVAEYEAFLRHASGRVETAFVVRAQGRVAAIRGAARGP